MFQNGPPHVSRMIIALPLSSFENAFVRAWCDPSLFIGDVRANNAARRCGDDGGLCEMVTE
jgi:hypothetical protein